MQPSYPETDEDCRRFPLDLKFPITREELRKYRETYDKLYEHNYGMEVAEDITKGILGSAYLGKTKRKFEFKKAKKIEKGIVVYDIYLFPRIHCTQQYLDDVILKRLKERFPDCTFTQDWAKKYLFVDWS
jgi:hypothetical protein